MKDMQSVIVAAWPWFGRPFEVDLNPPKVCGIRPFVLFREVLGYQFTYFWVPGRIWGMQSP